MTSKAKATRYAIVGIACAVGFAIFIGALCIYWTLDHK